MSPVRSSERTNNLGGTSSVSMGFSYWTSTLLHSHVHAEGLTKFDDDEHCSWLVEDSFLLPYWHNTCLLLPERFDSDSQLGRTIGS